LQIEPCVRRNVAIVTALLLAVGVFNPVVCLRRARAGL